jgi:glycosyltransferase involved in cell wall biosynthesis
MIMSVEVSVIVPIHNEIENLPSLYLELVTALEAQPRSFEIIWVDDGSTDGSAVAMRDMARRDRRLKVLLLRRNFGQTAAMHAGIQNAAGDYIVTIDGDLQNDPRDIARMLDLLDDGFDLVHGWRRDRKDAWLHRRLPSKIANALISRVTKFPIHDLGCTLKAMRTEIAQQMELYGEMHRFIPILAHQLGARAIEVETNHRPRRFGKTKYGIGRTVRVLLDLMTIRYMQKYFASPMKLFGMMGILCWLLALLTSATLVCMKLGAGVDMTGNPLLLLAVLSLILGTQFFSIGLLGEVCARIYFKSGNRQTYEVREAVNFQRGDDRPLIRVA